MLPTGAGRLETPGTGVEQVTSRSVLILFALLAVTPASCAQQRIVSIGPSGQLIEQLRYLDNTWPDQHAVALVVASESPICDQVTKASESSTWYCNIRVAASEFLALHWASQSPIHHLTSLLDCCRNEYEFAFGL